jgi:Protein of unknown function (DUF3467)
MAEAPDRSAGNVEIRYANYFSVGYGRCEVIFEFGQFYEGSDPQVHTRVVTTPSSASDLFNLLRDSLDQYRTSFGPIQQADSHE